MRVLIIKMSSMGDMIHTLPALTDAVKAIPNIQFDWVAEEAFTEIPLWHSNVNQVIPIALRRWRWHPLQTLKTGEFKKFLTQLRAQRYDIIIDAQASIKSSITSRITRGIHVGMDARSVRERFAQLAYDRTYFVERKQHAIRRLRQLFSQALGYPFVESMPDYAIQLNKLNAPSFSLPKKYVVFIHNASWKTKLWPEAYWMNLIKAARAKGFDVLLPWGNAQEHARALRLAADDKNVQVLPKLRLGEIAYILTHATAAVCADTGLSHLTAALNVPAITLYGPTNPELIGAVGLSQTHLRANFPCAPCKRRRCNYKKTSEQRPACFTTIQPERVWLEFEKLVR